MSITGSLVLYHNSPEVFEKAIESFLASADGVLYVVDNSSQPLQSKWFSSARVIYHFMGRNVGFGAAHNHALRKLGEESSFHLIMNPDVEFDSAVCSELGSYLAANERVGAVMPRVVYDSGEIQHLCKLLPTPLTLIVRRFMPKGGAADAVNARYVLTALGARAPSKVPIISGCFLMIRSSVPKSIGLFDERFFMYMEDVDLVRRIGSSFDVMYYPGVSIVHGYAKGSYKSKRLLVMHMVSAVKYFNKWGWFVDQYRKKTNDEAMNLHHSLPVG